MIERKKSPSSNPSHDLVSTIDFHRSDEQNHWPRRFLMFFSKAKVVKKAPISLKNMSYISNLPQTEVDKKKYLKLHQIKSNKHAHVSGQIILIPKPELRAF